MATLAMSSLQTILPLQTTIASATSSAKSLPSLASRRAIVFGSSVVVSSLLNLYSPSSTPAVLALQQEDDLQREEDRVVQLFQVFLPVSMIPFFSNSHNFANTSCFLTSNLIAWKMWFMCLDSFRAQTAYLHFLVGFHFYALRNC